MWCASPYECNLTSGKCQDKYTASGACGFLGESCCESGCASDLACAKGLCVQIQAVQDSTCGRAESPCCGEYEECDPGLLCEDKICKNFYIVG